MRVCVYIYIHMCIYVCTYVHVCVRVCACLLTFLQRPNVRLNASFQLHRTHNVYSTNPAEFFFLTQNADAQNQTRQKV